MMYLFTEDMYFEQNCPPFLIWYSKSKTLLWKIPCPFL